MLTCTFNRLHNVRFGITLDLFTQFLFRPSCKFCFHHMLIHILAYSVTLNYHMSVEVRKISRFTQIRPQINHNSDIYHAA